MAGFFKKLFTKFSRGSRIDWDELEADLVTADIGIRRAMNIADQLREARDWMRKTWWKPPVKSSARPFLLPLRPCPLLRRESRWSFWS
ncbi:signal recognition particle receptor subunit alpha [Akkermansia sp.]|uniref:signal recognition particle receptor subunit alpha n=1 Tax=Akkermansia sp. TaxID=1872421 RepID=UPI003AF80D6F